MEKQIQTANELNTEEIPKKVEIVKLSEWGYEKSGLYRGDPMALENFLRRIKEGHLVDVGFDEHQQYQRKKNASEKLLAKQQEKEQAEGTKNQIREHHLPAKEKEIGEKKDEIHEVKREAVEKTLHTGYSNARFWLLSTLCVLVGIYLIFFYASVINAAFFRNMQQVVEQADSNNVVLLLNSIFDPTGIFSGGTKLLFVYLAAAVFFAFGLVPYALSKSEGKYPWIKVVLFLLATLVIDGMLAYKIDQGMHELKTMMGLADATWKWYTSVNFYLVLAMGFGVYLVWGFLFEQALHEHDKKNMQLMANLEIKRLKAQLKLLEAALMAIHENVTRLETQIKQLVDEINHLQKQMDHALLNPDELLRNLESFYSGWLQYISGRETNLQQANHCNDVFLNYRKELESLNLSILN